MSEEDVAERIFQVMSWSRSTSFYGYKEDIKEAIFRAFQYIDENSNWDKE